MLDTFIIGLREGLEAALITSILIAYLVKLDRRSEVSKIFIGLSSAILIAVGVGFGLSFIDEEVSETAEATLSGVFSIVAAGFVTWMIFWMARQSRTLGSELRSKVDATATQWGLAAVAFFAVLREGIETALFLWAAVRTTSSSSEDASLNVWGAFIGLALAALIGYLIYRGAVKLNLHIFFTVTGAFLILVAAGITAYGVHELQEVGVLPFLTQQSYDLSAVLPENSPVEVLLRSTIAFNTAPSLLESSAWFLFVIPVSYLYARQLKK